MGQRETCFTSRVSKKLNNNYFSVNYVKETPLLPLFVINIGYGRQVEQRSVLSDNDRAVDQNLTTAHVLLEFNSAQRKGFWSVHRLVCYNTIQQSVMIFVGVRIKWAGHLAIDTKLTTGHN